MAAVERVDFTVAGHESGRFMDSFGVIMLIGIVKKNAIMLIDFANRSPANRR